MTRRGVRVTMFLIAWIVSMAGMALIWQAANWLNGEPISAATYFLANLGGIWAVSWFQAFEFIE